MSKETEVQAQSESGDTERSIETSELDDDLEAKLEAAQPQLDAIRHDRSLTNDAYFAKVRELLLSMRFKPETVEDVMKGIVPSVLNTQKELAFWMQRGLMPMEAELLSGTRGGPENELFIIVNRTPFTYKCDTAPEPGLESDESPGVSNYSLKPGSAVSFNVFVAKTEKEETSAAPEPSALVRIKPAQRDTETKNAMEEVPQDVVFARVLGGQLLDLVLCRDDSDRVTDSSKSKSKLELMTRAVSVQVASASCGDAFVYGERFLLAANKAFASGVSPFSV
jgi:hypothetical protein